MARTAIIWVRPTESTHRVTTLELFFDLVFVFAFIQVTRLMTADPTVVGAAHGLLLMAMLWAAWSAYAWLGNQARADEGLVRVTFVGAMVVMFVAALAIPESFADLPGGLFAPFVFAVCYTVVRLAHLACHFVVAGGDAEERRQLLRTGAPITASCALVLTGGALGPPHQTVLWTLAVVVGYTGVWVSGIAGWRLPSPGHFADRHGLILMVALGESLIAIGFGVAERPLSAPAVAASVLGLSVAVSLWWLYFDVVAHVAEGVLHQVPEAERAALARTSYSYLHFLIVVPVIFIATGLKGVQEHVSDPARHALADPLAGVPLVALYVGVAVHLAGHIAFRRREVGTWNAERGVVAVVLVLLLPVAGRLPALAALGLVAALLAVLVCYELLRFWQYRDVVRHSADPVADLARLLCDGGRSGGRPGAPRGPEIKW
jgi:low temperature requirement protein LtrA